jgi:hypothetical protein
MPRNKFYRTAAQQPEVKLTNFGSPTGLLRIDTQRIPGELGPFLKNRLCFDAFRLMHSEKHERCFVVGKSLRLCKQYGKKAQLCLIGGWRSSNWIYSLGAEPFASGKTGSVGPVRFLFWAILMLLASFCGQAVQGQDLSSKDAGRSVAVEPAKAEQTIPENELYAEAKRFLQTKDYASAFRLMEKAAAAGHLLAMNDLGDMYYSGDGVPQDYEQAFAWYRKGAMAGNVLAMANLAYLYEHGWGIGKDTVQACAWYRKAGAAGDQDSIRNLRWLDPNGEVVTPDETLTREWYQRRAFAGDADAMYKLGAMYAYGRGVPQDYAKAVEWYSKAARSGLADAMNDLGCLYAKGQGVPTDLSIAREWYKKAAEAGSPEGLQNLTRLNSIDAFIQSADRLARIFFWVLLLPGATILFIAMGRYSGRLRSQFSGPSRVKLALLLLWTNLALALARLSLASFLDQSLGVGFGCFIGAVGLAFHLVLLRFVGKGSNTARAILLAGVLLAIPLSPFLVQTAIKSFQSATFTIVGLALHASGVFLLFSGESSNWFSSRRRARTATEKPSSDVDWDGTDAAFRFNATTEATKPSLATKKAMSGPPREGMSGPAPWATEQTRASHAMPTADQILAVQEFLETPTPDAALRNLKQC